MAEQLGDKSFSALRLDQEDFTNASPPVQQVPQTAAQMAEESDSDDEEMCADKAVEREMLQTAAEQE